MSQPIYLDTFNNHDNKSPTLKIKTDVDYARTSDSLINNYEHPPIKPEYWIYDNNLLIKDVIKSHNTTAFDYMMSQITILNKNQFTDYCIIHDNLHSYKYCINTLNTYNPTQFKTAITHNKVNITKYLIQNYNPNFNISPIMDLMTENHFHIFRKCLTKFEVPSFETDEVDEFILDVDMVKTVESLNKMRDIEKVYKNECCYYYEEYGQRLSADKENLCVVFIGKYEYRGLLFYSFDKTFDLATCFKRVTTLDEFNFIINYFQININNIDFIESKCIITDTNILKMLIDKKLINKNYITAMFRHFPTPFMKESFKKFDIKLSDLPTIDYLNFDVLNKETIDFLINMVDDNNKLNPLIKHEIFENVILMNDVTYVKQVIDKLCLNKAIVTKHLNTYAADDIVTRCGPYNEPNGGYNRIRLLYLIWDLNLYEQLNYLITNFDLTHDCTPKYISPCKNHTTENHSVKNALADGGSRYCCNYINMYRAIPKPQQFEECCKVCYDAIYE